MGDKYPFAVEDHKFESSEKLISAGEIIRRAQKEGIEVAKGEIDKITLKSEKMIYTSKERIDLTDENHFQIGGPAYNFKVNGQELQSALEKLVAADIVTMAIKAGAAPERKYQLKGKDYVYAADEWVDLSDNHEFTLLPTDPTPVA